MKFKSELFFPTKKLKPMYIIGKMSSYYGDCTFALHLQQDIILKK